MSLTAEVRRAMNRLQALANAAFCAAYRLSGLARLQEALERRAGRHFMVILLFHRVTDLVPEDGITVGTTRFRRICRLLKNRFRVVPLGEVHETLLRRRPMPPRTVAITFDDCYRDNLDAARVLAEHGLPATFFIPTAYVGTDHVFPWDADLPTLPNLTWDDVREMARLGFEIGSHTVSHPDMGRISFEEARRELVDSRQELQKQLNRPVRWFAYPFGGVENFSADLLPLIEATGYDAGFSAHGGFVGAESDPRLLPREAVPYFKSLLHLELHLRGCLRWAYALKRRLGLSGPPPSGVYHAPKRALADAASTAALS
jgi:peptidoglycan/xylan/chitin deacetylase (PgdA/CDA1 family)